MKKHLTLLNLLLLTLLIVGASLFMPKKKENSLPLKEVYQIEKQFTILSYTQYENDLAVVLQDNETNETELVHVFANCKVKIGKKITLIQECTYINGDFKGCFYLNLHKEVCKSLEHSEI